MTVMLFQLEGSDDTLQEGFRTINSAIDKLANPVVRVIGQQPVAKGLSASKNGNDGGSHVLEAEIFEDELEAETTTPEAAKTKKGPTGAPRQPKVLDLDLKTGSKSLREYLEEKNPTSHARKSLLISAWLKASLATDEVTMDHIYTGYRHMGWTSPKDITSPLRGMKRKNGWFAKGKEEGAYAINHIGVDVAERTNGE